MEMSKKVKEGAIEAIVEKEKIILELKGQMRDNEIE
jgi:hypothetical protein